MIYESQPLPLPEAGESPQALLFSPSCLSLSTSNLCLFILFRTLLRSPKTQLFSFQAIPNSFAKTPGGGVPLPFDFSFSIRSSAQRADFQTLCFLFPTHSFIFRSL